ncbi:MAG: hypothetical protein O3A82_10775 [Verrucomicrobia bacterium]|nr:hypothetical protein [Verrucomicrobiota bacterium]
MTTEVEQMYSEPKSLVCSGFLVSLSCHCEEGQSPDAAIQRTRRASRITTSTGLPRPAGLAMTACGGDDLDWIAMPCRARNDSVWGRRPRLDCHALPGSQ